MAAVAVGGKAVCLDSYRAKRTEAMPKTTLFGSSLERPDENTARSVREMDLSTVTVPRTPGGKGAGQKFTLPEELKRQLPGAAVLERSRREFQNQRARVLGHSDDLRRREIEVFYGPDRFPASAPSPREPGVSRPTWFTKDDLYASNEINTLGLNNNQSFNRDKYGHKAPVHKYSLIGDVLRPGMDFPRRERTEIQMRNQGYGKGDMRGALARSPPRIGQVSAQLSRKPAELAPLVVPPNIKHKFGSKVCDNLLSDKAVVDHTIEEQKRAKETIERKSHPFIVQKFSREANPDYDMLGNALRMNVVPGYSTDQTISTTKTAFNDQVHLFRYQDPDKWRYQKDELSKWREARFMQILLAKGWDTILSDAPTFKRDWAKPEPRTKTAPTTIENQNRKPVQHGRRKAPPKTAPSEEKKKDVGFEDVVFETPPETPPPEQVKLSNADRKDSEFWKFYDKGAT